MQQTIDRLGRLDILVNNAAEQQSQDNVENISAEQLERTFRTNIFSSFYMAKLRSSISKKETLSSTRPRLSPT